MRCFARAEQRWQVHLDGTRVCMRAGEGRDDEVTLPSRAAAEARLAELVASRLSEGFVELARPPGTPPEPRYAADDDAPHCRRLERRDDEGMHALELIANGSRLRRERTVIYGDGPDDVSEDVSEAEHGDPASALRMLERVVAAQLARGWTLVGHIAPLHAASAPVNVARSEPLEVQCRASRRDPAPWAIYADYLISHGDPTGEVAALRQRGEDVWADRVLGRRTARMFGDYAPPLRAHVSDLEWRHGFVSGATLTCNGQLRLKDVVRRFLALPVARFVDALRFGLSETAVNDWAPSLAAVTSSAQAPHLRVLRLDGGTRGPDGSAAGGRRGEIDAYTRSENELSWTALGDLSRAWRYVPALEYLHIRGGASGELGDLDLPALRTFIRESAGIGRAQLDAILAARWPALEHLELWLGPTFDGAQDQGLAEIERIARGDGTPQLSHLGLVNYELVGDAVEVLATSRLLPRLRTLDLSRGTLAGRGAAALLAHARRFAHLDWIDVSDNYLTPDDAARLLAAIPQIQIGAQRGDAEDGDPAVRYVAVVE